MARINTDGLDEFVAQLESLGKATQPFMKAAVWEGAHVVADSIKSAIGGIPVQDEYVPPDKTRAGITSEEKAGLTAGFGITKMRVGDNVDVRIGFKGKAVSGESNAAIARSVESGTSFMAKHPFVRPAVNRARAAAMAAMSKKFGEMIDKVMD